MFVVQLPFLFVLDEVPVLCICFCIYLSCIHGVARLVCVECLFIEVSL